MEIIPLCQAKKLDIDRYASQILQVQDSVIREEIITHLISIRNKTASDEHANGFIQSCTGF